MDPTKKCPECGKVPEKKSGPGRWPKYCSAECKRTALGRVRKLKKNEGSCAHCGDPLPDGWTRKYCSVACRKAYHNAQRRTDEYRAQVAAAARQRTVERAAARPCPYCNGPMTPLRFKHCGAPECRRQYNNERVREFMRKHKAENGVSYVARYRTPEHYVQLAALPKIPERMAARKQEGCHRRRAQKLKLPAEKFRHEDVYERDGWICGLCTEPVDRELRYPDPMSPSLDHVVPLARGGHHVLENVQLAHLICNVKKQARVAEEAT